MRRYYSFCWRIPAGIIRIQLSVGTPRFKRKLSRHWVVQLVYRRKRKGVEIRHKGSEVPYRLPAFPAELHTLSKLLAGLDSRFSTCGTRINTICSGIPIAPILSGPYCSRLLITIISSRSRRYQCVRGRSNDGLYTELLLSPITIQSRRFEPSIDLQDLD